MSKKFWPNTKDNGNQYTAEEILDNAAPFLHKSGDYPGIYFLICDEEIVYVGKSVNVKTRLDQHSINPDKNFNRYFAILCDKEELNSLEAHYILRFRPKYNIAIPKEAENE